MKDRKNMKSKTIENRIEFYNIIQEYAKNEEFQKMKSHSHHGTTRYDHSTT